MPDIRSIPIDRSPDVVTFTILINGKAVAPTYSVKHIAARHELNRISTALISIVDGDAAEGSFKASSSESFVPGNEIEIKVGYHSDESTIFKGLIISHGITVKSHGQSYLNLECKDLAVKMTVGRKNRYFYEQSDSDIFELLMDEYGLQKEIASTNVVHKEVLQYNSTDWDFIISRAEKNGLFCWMDAGVLKVFKPDASADSLLHLTYGATLFDFEAEIDARTQFKKVKASSWDYANQELLQSEGNSSISLNGNITSDTLSEIIGLNEYELRHGGQVVEAELQAWADAQLMRSQLSKIRGRVSFQGIKDVKPGVLITLNGVGDRFNGKAFVTGIRHTVSEGNWKMDAQLGLNPEWFTEKFNINQNPATGLLPAVPGLQIGLVTKLENDPDGEFRIQIRLPIINPGEDGIWARMSNMDAGENRGAFFLPEIGDEVVVGFLNDDPRDPIVLGMLYSSAKPAPMLASDDNHEKGWVTRSEIKILFDDDKKIVTIQTPAGNKVVLDDDSKSCLLLDEHQNKIEMTKDGILIESLGKIEIKAKKDLEMEGLNVNAKANMQFNAEGSAGAELSSSGSTTVKGSMVQIN